jgi:hypothetical protein
VVEKDTNLEEVNGHIPLATVREDLTGEVVDHTVIERGVGRFYGEFEEVVGLVEFVPKEGICLDRSLIIYK